MTLFVCVIGDKLCSVNISLNFLLIAVSDEELKKRIAEELALERARRDSEAQKRRLFRFQCWWWEFILRNEIANIPQRNLFFDKSARQLEEKDRELKKHDAYYKEQLARLEERSAQFYKVTTEQYQKAADEVSARFKRYESHPICGELQDKILQCYREHAQETLSCSALASQYLNCVNHAKQVNPLGITSVNLCSVKST
uniref:Coiled-coil-helix-coiled-coil-helix domain containing 3 n=1 Tax=Junco hyemalis TaxID=40217 RepID=A0A8C5JSU4_JUNHY